MRQDRCCHRAKAKAHRAFKRAQADHHSKCGDQRPGSKCKNERFRGGMDWGDPGALGGEKNKIFLRKLENGLLKGKRIFMIGLSLRLD